MTYINWDTLTDEEKAERTRQYEERRAQEIAQEKEEREKTIALAQAVAYHLGWRYVPAPEESYALGHIAGTTYEHISIHREAYGADRGRMTFTGYYDDVPLFDRQKYRPDYIKTSVAPNRPPKAIAQQIRARLLPAYQQEIKNLVDTCSTNEQERQTREMYALRLAAVAGVNASNVRKDRDDYGYEFNLYHSPLGVSGNVESGYSGITIKLHSLSIEKATAILDALATYKGEN